ncbi:MAG: hypothetical protein JSV88_17790 [Candidatus Aminicenantes bacterium]|nr:MAG: hypothetical protein JSV88_17790 [Candidatus Aminicenantes bacterium]
MGEYDALMDLSIIALFLLAGVVIKARVTVFKKLVMPASVIGGVLGLILGRNVLGLVPTSDSMSQYAVALIDVIFAGLFIGRKIPGVGTLTKRAGAQAAFAYFNAFGQIAIGLMIVVVFSAVGFGLHPLFAIELAAGFQGGPGTATALAPMFEKLGWSAQESAAVGETCAIFGLVFAILIGVILANIGIARSFSEKKFQGPGNELKYSVFVRKNESRAVAREITSPETASTLAFAFCFMALAIIGGKLIVNGIVTLVPPLKVLPSFPFVLVAGLVLQVFLQKTGWDIYVDRGSIEGISAFALDVLIVASLIAINLKAIAVFALPLITMMVLGLLFNLWQATWLAPRILPGAWFEKALCEFGQSTGSISQSMLLLRMVDPRFETDAAEAFALKMFLYSPVVFPLTIGLLPFIVSLGPLLFLGFYCGAMLIVFVICRAVTWQRREKIKWVIKNDRHH